VRGEAEEYDIPVIVAGDIFDVWKSPPELVNFVIRLFRGLPVYAIPGQHDLPNHVYDDMHRSSYGTLVEAGAIENVHTCNSHIPGVVMWPCPWGFEIKPVERIAGSINLLVAHKYVWTAGHKYPGAPEEASLAGLKKQLEGYDAAVFGDNHKQFLAKAGRCNVLNCGTFIPRKSDERAYKPCYGLLMSDGSIKQLFIDTSQDKWLEPEEGETADEPMNLTGLIDDFESLGGDALNFVEVLERCMESNATDGDVKKLVLKALDEGRRDEA